MRPVRRIAMMERSYLVGGAVALVALLGLIYHVFDVGVGRSGEVLGSSHPASAESTRPPLVAEDDRQARSLKLSLREERQRVSILELGVVDRLKESYRAKFEGRVRRGGSLHKWKDDELVSFWVYCLSSVDKGVVDTSVEILEHAAEGGLADRSFESVKKPWMNRDIIAIRRKMRLERNQDNSDNMTAVDGWAIKDPGRVREELKQMLLEDSLVDPVLDAFVPRLADENTRSQAFDVLEMFGCDLIVEGGRLDE